MKVTKCRLCQSQKLHKSIDLGFHPLADTFLYEDQVVENHEPHYLLTVNLCMQCGHMQTGYVVSAYDRYQNYDYSYDSSNSKVSIEHFSELASDVISRLDLREDDFVLDIGSNIGTLLEHFRNKVNAKIFGIEPAKNIAELAIQKGIPTINRLFDETAIKYILRHGTPKVVVTTNVFNHAEELDDFVNQVDRLLLEDGTFVIEVPYLKELVERTAFDTIYLEHVNYFSVAPLVKFFKKFNFKIAHLETIDYMCGTLRLYVNRKNENRELIDKFISDEVKLNLTSHETYQLFMRRVREMKFSLNVQLYNIKVSGGKIIGIGAATKGNTLMNYCNIDGDLLEYVTDSSALKHNKFTPGSHLKILPDEDITSDITHALILPWNIADYLVEKLEPLGLKFLIPQIPSIESEKQDDISNT
jgi:SAM-dependent methyltransferase